MTHKKISRFTIDGIILDEADIPRKRAQLESLLTQRMRSVGYIRVLDLDTAFSTDYDGSVWSFTLTIQGIYVGRRKAELWEGYSMGKMIQRHTQKSKQEPS